VAAGAGQEPSPREDIHYPTSRRSARSYVRDRTLSACLHEDLSPADPSAPRIRGIAYATLSQVRARNGNADPGASKSVTPPRDASRTDELGVTTDAKHETRQRRRFAARRRLAAFVSRCMIEPAPSLSAHFRLISTAFCFLCTIALSAPNGTICAGHDHTLV
jgi:hypothetical protein